MNTTKIIMVVGIVVLLVLAGCSSGAERSYPRPSGPVGGGCGVAAPADNNNAAEAVATVPETAVAA